MTIPSNTEILMLLGQLDSKIADDLESEYLDFKPWTGSKEDMKTAVEYAVCFANANGGVVVFGVTDRTKGRKAAIHGIKVCDIDTWKRGIYAATNPNLLVDVAELSVPEGTGKLLLVRVPQGDSPPYGTAQGLYKKRVGKNCMPLDVRRYQKQQISSGAVDWSGQTANGVSVADLDPVEIARARNIIRKLKPQSDITKLSDDDFLKGLYAVRDGKITHAGLLLFGREEALSEKCPQHLVHYTYQVAATRVPRNDSYRMGILAILENIEQIFSGPINPEHEHSVGMLKIRIPAFPIDVVREAVLNAVTHRDYTDPGKILIRHSEKELVVCSPGGFPSDITPENILRHEPVPRNITLANAFVKLGLVESSGVGRRRIFVPMLSYGKRSPVYESDGGRVILHIFNGTFDERMATLVAKWNVEGHELDLDALLIMSYLRENAFIDTLSASDLLQWPRDRAKSVLDQLTDTKTGFLERRGNTRAATYHLTKGFAKDLLSKASYTKIRGVNPIRYAEMVSAFVGDYGAITPKECRELLGLGESNSAKAEVSRYLRKWSGKTGFLTEEGVSPKNRYVLKPDH